MSTVKSSNLQVMIIVHRIKSMQDRHYKVQLHLEKASTHDIAINLEIKININVYLREGKKI
jgi:hypothetical protein